MTIYLEALRPCRRSECKSVPLQNVSPGRDDTCFAVGFSRHNFKEPVVLSWFPVRNFKNLLFCQNMFFVMVSVRVI